MKQELVRINSIDGLEEVGLLYSPINGTDRIVIHVHGLNGNFYENRFLDTGPPDPALLPETEPTPESSLHRKIPRLQGKYR